MARFWQCLWCGQPNIEGENYKCTKCGKFK
jgi:DNA-directed RNA polymerase subunit RPC12/RpoP